MRHADVIQIGDAVASALDYAHHKGVIHRDVKPSNVMIGTDNRIILTDFGLATSVSGDANRQVAGTPHYMAPEQARDSESVVPQSDIYSMGIMLYELLTGELPFNDPSPASVALQHYAIAPPSPRDINPRLNSQTEAVLLKALSKKPGDRYQSGYELMDALEEALLAEPLENEADNLPPALDAIMAPAISPMTLADKLRLYQQRKQTTLKYAEPAPASTNRPAISGPVSPSAILTPLEKNTGLFWFFAGLLAAGVFIVIGLLGFLILLRGDDSGEPQAEVVETLPSTQAATEPPQDTLTVAPTSLPTANNSEPIPVDNLDGDRLVFFYNDNSFYIYNDSESYIGLDALTFERLDSNGAPTNRLEGWRFAQFAPNRRLTPYWCVEFEIFYAIPYLEPGQCVASNSTLRPGSDSPLIFWTTLEGSTQFRVSWNGTEIAQCEIGAGQCEVLLP
jgi:serine/threonine protein kinase